MSLIDKLTDYLIQRRLRKERIYVSELESDKTRSAFSRVLNTLRENRVMVSAKDDGIYIRLAGNESKGDAFTLEWAKVYSYDESKRKSFTEDKSIIDWDLYHKIKGTKTEFIKEMPLVKGSEVLYSEDEVERLLETQRGNCYVAVLTKTMDEEIATVAVNAPEPAGGKWRKNDDGTINHKSNAS